MFFILQKENKQLDLDIDILTLKQQLGKQHEYTFYNLNDFQEECKYPNYIKEGIPVGSIEFVEKYLKIVHNIDSMNPIEIPSILRDKKYLCRDYSIVKAEDIPRIGNYFIKDVSKLKEFSYNGKMEYLFYDEIFDEKKPGDLRVRLNKDHLYQVSSCLDILAEYRVFVSDDKIKGIQFYDGNPLIMPTPTELDKLKEIVLKYILDKDRPKSYSLDIAIIKSNNEFKRDLAILEIHPFACLGLYGITGSFLPYAYRDGLDYYININKKLKAD